MIEPTGDTLLVHFRIGGVVKRTISLSTGFHAGLVASVGQQPVNLRLASGKSVRLNSTISPSPHGEKILLEISAAD